MIGITLEDCEKEISFFHSEWEKGGLPDELVYLAFALLGLEYYQRVTPDSAHKSAICVQSIQHAIGEHLKKEHKEFGDLLI